MAKLGDQIGNAFESLSNATNAANNSGRSFEQDGFIVPPIPTPSGDGLPSSKIKPQQSARTSRHIVHWFVPEVGVINMYINPQSIVYNFKKLITPERTKGGYTIQMWGEELTTLNLSGHTGSSGVEGLNVLYEIYRAEQINFDPIALTMASNSVVSGLEDTISDLGQKIGGGFGGDVFSSAVGGILGTDPKTQSLLPRNPPTLSSLAFSVEMYYSGKVYRGYFTSMTVTESAERLGLFNYEIQFTVTQQRGYRLNTMPWHRSANSGPSNNSEGGVPLSFGKGLSPGR